MLPLDPDGYEPTRTNDSFWRCLVKDAQALHHFGDLLHNGTEGDCPAEVWALLDALLDEAEEEGAHPPARIRYRVDENGRPVRVSDDQDVRPEALVPAELR